MLAGVREDGSLRADVDGVDAWDAREVLESSTGEAWDRTPLGPPICSRSKLRKEPAVSSSTLDAKRLTLAVRGKMCRPVRTPACGPGELLASWM